MTLPQPEKTVRVLYVRHGETDDNVRQVIQGHIDTQLNEHGIIQAEIVRDHLKDTKIDICWTSTLQRARRTAEIIMEPHAGSPLIEDERIKEKYLGALEGTIYYTAQPPEAKATIEQPAKFIGRLLHFHDSLFPPPGAETPSILPPNDKDVLTVLVVSHGGPIKTLIPALVKERGFEWRPSALQTAQAVKYKVYNCSITEVVCRLLPASESLRSAYSGEIQSFADVAHFIKAKDALKEGTEADAALSAEEQQKERMDNGTSG